MKSYCLWVMYKEELYKKKMNPYSDYQNIQDKKMFIKYELIDR